MTNSILFMATVLVLLCIASFVLMVKGHLEIRREKELLDELIDNMEKYADMQIERLDDLVSELEKETEDDNVY